MRWHGPGNGKEDKAFAEQWKNGCGDFIRLSASSSWRNANRVDSDLEEVLYYFMKLGKNRGMESRVGKDKKKRVMEILKK